MNVVVRPQGREALVDWGKGPRRAAIGRAGIGVKQSEGDGITPVGTFALRRVLYRPDRHRAPSTKLAHRALEPDDGWCDAPAHPAYNRPIKMPFDASHEPLWRDDHLYDLIAVLGFNDDPVVPGKGSAIFLHVARADYGATEGCIALAVDDLVELLAALAPGDTVTITL